MNFKNSIFTTSAFVALTTTTAFADAGSTQVLNDYFQFIEKSPLVLNVSNKADNLRSTKWSGISIASEDGNFVINIPWVEVKAGLLGGHTMSFAEKSDGIIQGGELGSTEKVLFEVTHQGFEMTVTGDEDDRSFEGSYAEMGIASLPGSFITFDMDLSGGQSIANIKKGATDVFTGRFSVADSKITYDFDIEGQKTDADMTMTGLSGDYVLDWDSTINLDDPRNTIEALKQFSMNYVVQKTTSKTNVNAGLGPMSIDVTSGLNQARMGFVNKEFDMSTSARDMVYRVAGMGLPPMKVTFDNAEMGFGFPFDNVAKAKSADLKMKLLGLEMEETLWSMFDPLQKLPRTKADLDIDVNAQVIWDKKIAEIDPDTQEPPMRFESVNINALNLRAVGADLKANGSLDINNASFPPVPTGELNIDLAGSSQLLDALTAAGLLPAQQALMARGMMGMFFKSGAGDTLNSVIEFTPNGGIMANGVPIK
ncbi:hypothetical protein GCM10007939_19230 [Amylibacter marinus]|uniref:DUF2125 domain-containing protein n=1 Tax=Amylibacter marinus TaxID=1475483 RepID=A0ABQ5VWB4_9RHOB|nr:DUF2125 domain-containing protein [Amylibacter marinus]GLQ35640.1 hypothetical protein GCM10007939_19230 [Amylibacter marinus]